jgi:hypothetical protein
LARALDLHSRGQGFDSLILHEKIKRRKTEVGSQKKMLQNEKESLKRQNVHRNTEQTEDKAGA